MYRIIIAGLVAAPVLLVGCQSPNENATDTAVQTQVEDAIPAAQQVVLKVTGMT